jgi:glycosyltransferase involved in cell wall biosynthesis
MKIAIDISPLQSGHKIRGVGFYLEYLKRSLLTYYPNNEYLFFNSKKELHGDIDLVHYPYFDPFFLTLPLAKKFKTIVTVHDLTPLKFSKHFPAGVKGNLRWQIQLVNLKRSDAIITDSYSSQKDIIKITGVNQEKIAVVYLAAAEEFTVLKNKESKTKYIKNKYHLPDTFVLSVGDVTWNKNIPRLIKAMKEVNLPLVLVGKSLAEKNFDRQNIWNKDLVEVDSLIENDKRFIRIGFVPTEDLVALYNAATVFVMPSLYEGFGLPVLEAMQCGCPVVTTKNGSLSEVGSDAAFYIDAFDSHSIASGIDKVFFSKILQQDLTQKGLQQVKKFSWEKTAQQTMAVYTKVMSKK